MKRRKFLAGLAGAAVWPIAVLAQQPERMRRIAVLMNAAADDLQAQHHLAAFRRALQELNWTEGGNIQTDSRWGADDVETALRYAVELVALAPDVILAAGGAVVAAVQRASRTVPLSSPKQSTLSVPVL